LEQSREDEEEGWTEAERMRRKDGVKRRG